MTILRKKVRPPDRPFRHDSACKTPKAVPEWIDMTGGTWSRTCSCRCESWHESQGQLDPNCEAARPHWTEHHGPQSSCTGARVPELIKCERRTGGGWLTTCLVCDSQRLWWWCPQYFVRNDNGDAVRVDRYGPATFVYRRAVEAEVPVS